MEWRFQFNRHLQVLDSSFNIIHSRVLDILETVNTRYSIIVPLSGKFFILQWEFTAEVIDSSTFKTVEVIDSDSFKEVEQLSPPRIIDTWEDDRLLSASYSRSGGIPGMHFFEKKIGASQWNDLGLIQTK